jgi:hypothetical protein
LSRARKGAMENLASVSPSKTMKIYGKTKHIKYTENKTDKTYGKQQTDKNTNYKSTNVQKHKERHNKKEMDPPT